MAEALAAPNGDDGGLRPDTDDYDLLTFGEVAARLTEELAAEKARLEDLRSEADADRAQIRLLEERIELLQASGERYRSEEQTNEAFTRRFRSAITTAGQRWQ